MIYLLFGENDFAIQARVDELVAEFKSRHGESGIEKLSGDEINEQTIQNIVAQSLFSEAKIIVVDSISENKNGVRLLTEVIEQIPDTTDLVLREQKLKKNTTFYKDMKKAGQAREFTVMRDHEVANWVQQFTADLGGKIDPQSARMLVQRAGLNQLLLSNEIRKLLAHDKTINKDSIELLVESKPEDNVFEMLDLVGRGKSDEARAQYRKLRNAQAEPHYIMSMIGWQLTNMATVVAHQGKSPQQIASDSGMSPFVVQKTVAITRNLNRKSMKELLNLALETDVKLKKSAASPDQLVEQLIDRLSLKLTTS